jgi:hypothetical protein
MDFYNLFLEMKEKKKNGLKRTLWLIFFSLFSSFVLGQERFSMIFNEQAYLLNPAFAGLTNKNRISFSLGYQGIGENNYKNLQASISHYNKHINGGIEGYSVMNKEGLLNHSLIAMQLSRFFHIHGIWSLSLGVAPELHNFSINSEKVVLESQLLSYSGISAVFPSVWGASMTVGGALFSQNHTFGFAVQSLFEKINILNRQEGPRTYRYIFSAGSNIDLHPFRNITNKTFFRPHFVIVNQTKGTSFFYGGFWGNVKNQFGMFFVSTTQYPFLGISPAFSVKGKAVSAIFSLKILPKLPSMYMFGNDMIVQGTW